MIARALQSGTEDGLDEIESAISPGEKLKPIQGYQYSVLQLDPTPTQL
jgi:hypothetical protein